MLAEREPERSQLVGSGGFTGSLGLPGSGGGTGFSGSAGPGIGGGWVKVGMLPEDAIAVRSRSAVELRTKKSDG